MSQITLGELIEGLRLQDPDTTLKMGLSNPHSSRAYFRQVAFEPAYNVTVREVLADVSAALGATYAGHNGEPYRMTANTGCWLAEEGKSGEELTSLAVRLMFLSGDEPCTEEAAPAPAPAPVVPPTPAEEVAAAAARIRGDWLGEVMDFGPFAEALAAWLEMVAETLASGHPDWQRVEVPDTIMTLVRIINKEG